MILKLVRVRKEFSDKINKHVFENDEHIYTIGSRKLLKHVGSDYDVDLDKCLDLHDVDPQAITIKGHSFYIHNINKVAIRIIDGKEDEITVDDINEVVITIGIIMAIIVIGTLLIKL